MIRPYTSSDEERVVDVWYQASLIAHAFLSEEILASERRAMSERWLPMAETLVYEADGVVLGFLSLVGNEVGAIFVDPEHQRQGVGSALMDAANEARPHLELEVLEANSRGRRFYEAYGFRLVDRHTNEASGHPALRLRLDDDPTASNSTSQSE